MCSRKRFLVSMMLSIVLVNVGWSMEMATNFWNIQWGNTWHDYFAEGVDWSTTTNPWRQDFLSDMAPYTALRFMDFVPTNNSTVRYWSERIGKTANHYATGGVAYEWQIDLCNRVGADIWITVPHLTVEDYEANPSSNYWVSLANLIKQQLDPDLDVIVEYSNETWNNQFTQGTYCANRGVAMGFDPDGYSASFHFHVYAALRLHKVFQDVFTDQPWRVRTVIAGQAGSGWQGDKNWGTYCQILALQNPSINPWGLVPDFYSVAPYAGGGLNGASATIQSEWTASVAQSVAAIQAPINTMAQHYTTILPICLYECGQHILNNSDVFARNPLSYDMYTEYLNAIDDNVVFAAHYNHTGTWASGGAWGAKESTWQSLADAHKYRALRDYAYSQTTDPPEHADFPSPTNGATDVIVTTVLSWAGGAGTASHDVYFGTNATPGPGEFQGNQPSISFDPGPLANSTTYYWRIDEVNPHGTTTGLVWSFTTESPTIRINPIADASSQSGDCDTTNLSFSQWNYAFIKFDLSTIFPPIVSAKLRLRYESSQPLTIIVSDATTDDWTECVSTPSGPGGTVMDSNYAPGAGWYEFDVNSYVEAEAAGDDVITFTVTSDYGGWTSLGAREGPNPPELAIVQLNPPPGLPSNPSPANGAAGVSTDAELYWTAGADATSHDVYFGTASPPPFLQNRTETSFAPGPLSAGTTYYWRIDERNDYGVTTGVTWSFATAFAPVAPTNPSPANGATNVNRNSNLSWTPGAHTTSYDVYLGTAAPPAFVRNQTSNQFEPGTMAANTLYYWRIDARNDADLMTTGTQWSFTTGIDEGDGLVGIYYDNNDFTNHKFTRVDPRVSFSWGAGSPDAAIGPDTFSVRWVGLLQPRYSETYTFTTYTSDGVRLWVDANLIIDKWFDQEPMGAWSGTAELQAGEKYDIQMDYYENVGGAMAYLRWSSASQAEETIPQGRLFSVWPEGDLNRDYFVDCDDFDIFADQWLTTPDCNDPNCADLDGSNNVDFADLALLGQNFGL